MQVERQSSSLLTMTPSPLSGGAAGQARPVSSSALINPTPQTARQNAFPDAPRLSSQPLRYNVQLNDQLTSVQQAENFLQTTEKQLLKLCHSVSGRAGSGEIQAQAMSLKKVLGDRQSLSAGTVDRNMQVSLTSKAQVNFGLRNSDALVNSGNSETLMFSLAGNRRELSAVSLGQDASNHNSVLRLNQALGQWGIHATTRQQQVQFRVEESQWSRVSQHLSVQGEGERFPQGQFVPLRPQAEMSLEDVVAVVAAEPGRAGGHLPQLQSSLEEITRQRSQLKISKASVRQRIDGMATYAPAGSAEKISARLGSQLNAASETYAALATAVGAQANVHALTVRNVLSAVKDA